jgi:hypothetical protein
MEFSPQLSPALKRANRKQRVKEIATGLGVHHAGVRLGERRPSPVFQRDATTGLRPGRISQNR